MAIVVTDGNIQALRSHIAGPGMNVSQPFTDTSGAALAYTDVYKIAYLEIWRTQASVRTCVSFLARNIAQIGLHLFDRVGDTERTRVTDGPVARVLKRPNPWTTPYRFMDTLVHDLGIYNRAYLLKMKGDGGGLSLLRLDPRVVNEDYHPAIPDLVTGFTVTLKDGSRKAYPADAIVFLRGYEKSSPLEALRRTLAEEWSAGIQREQVLRNGARLSGYLQRPETAPKWNEETRSRFVRSWQSQYSGPNAERPGGTPILEDGMTFEKVAQTAEELQYVEARKLTREEVASAYFIPPPLVGILDHATFSNIREQHKQLYADTLGPWLTSIQQDMELQVVEDLLGPETTMYVEFNIQEKLRGSFEEQAAHLQKAVGGPYMTRNEARALQNMAPLEGGDELITPLSVTAGGQSDPSDTDTSDEDATDEEPINDPAQ